jgi:hypothetical protein
MAAAAPAGPPPTTSTSKSSFSPSSRPCAGGGAGIHLGDDLLDGHAALAEGLAVEVHVGTAMILRSLTSSWNRAPSIMVLVMPGFSTAIRLSACTTSGQLWQDREMIGLEVEAAR